MKQGMIYMFAKTSLVIYLSILLVSFGHSIYTQHTAHTHSGACKQTHTTQQICKNITSPLKTDGFQTELFFVAIALLWYGILVYVSGTKPRTSHPFIISIFTYLFRTGILHPKAP